MDKLLLRDYLSARVIADNKQLDDYSKMYYKTNENLVDLYLDLDFEDKSVLSVVSSSDQIFTPMLLGAREVDGFDKNRLTKYYYYLRKWVIKYNKEVYPMDMVQGNKDYLIKLLEKVRVSSEEEAEAYKFWRLLHNHDTNIENLFTEDDRNIGKTLFDDNIHYLEELNLGQLNFYDYNFFDDLDGSKKYDIIMMSNILETSRNSLGKLVVARNNLNRLLKSDGIVICSHLIHQATGMNGLELEVFDKDFDYIDYGLKNGYIYVKKK